MLYISRDKQYFIKDKSTNSVVEFNIYNMITRDYLQTVLVLTNNYNQLWSIFIFFMLYRYWSQASNLNDAS